MQETREMLEELLKKNCPIVAAWKTKGRPIKCLFFGIGDNCGACSFAWPELSQQILDELSSGKQGIESYRKRAQNARAGTRKMDKALADATRAIFHLGDVIADGYREAGGTEEISYERSEPEASQLAEADRDDTVIPEGGHGSSDSGGQRDEDGGA